MASRDMSMWTIRGTSNSGNTAAARPNSSRTGTPESLSRSGNMPPDGGQPRREDAGLGAEAQGLNGDPAVDDPSAPETVMCMRNPAMLTLPGTATDIVFARFVASSSEEGGFHHDAHQSPDRPALRKQATELARGGTNLYRVRAFRQAAMTVLALPEELSALVAANGQRALERASRESGESLAETIAAYLESRLEERESRFRAIELTLCLCTSYTFTG